jgi:hypothetical protein
MEKESVDWSAPLRSSRDPSVIPAKAGIQTPATRGCRMRTPRERQIAPHCDAHVASWILAFARMTLQENAVYCLSAIAGALTPTIGPTGTSSSSRWRPGA